CRDPDRSGDARASPLRCVNPGRTIAAAAVMRSSSSRRSFVAGLASVGALAALGLPRRAFGAPVGSAAELGFSELPDGALAEQTLYALPGKLPLIKKTFRDRKSTRLNSSHV